MGHLVYSILNARGKPTAYKDKESLIDKNLMKIEERSKLRFKEDLNGHYEDNIILNVYLGFLSVGQPNRREFRKDRYKIEEIFGKNKKGLIPKVLSKIQRKPTEEALEKAHSFSNLKEIEKLIQKLLKEAPNEIIISNTYKFLKSLEDIVSKILKEKKNFDSGIKESKEQITETLNRSEEIITKYQNEILNCIKLEIDNMENEIKDCVYTGIENKWSEKYLNERITGIQKQCVESIKKKTKSLLNEMKHEIEETFAEFKKRIALSLRFKGLRVEVDINEVIKELQINFKYVIDRIIDVGLSIWGIVAAWAINPILGVIVLIVAAFREILDLFWGDPAKRKRKAKKNAYSKIKTSINKLRSEFRYKMSYKISKLKRNVKKQIEGINFYMRDLEHFSFCISEKIKEINNMKVEISTLLTKYILGNDIKFSYIDLQLDRIVIIGNSFQKVDMEILRLKDIFHYNSLEDFLENVKHTFDNEILILQEKDEFIYRALTSFTDKLGVKGVRRIKL